MNKILAEGSSQNITVVNGKVIDNNNLSFKLKSNDNKKFDIDVMNNEDGFLIRELNKKELIKLLKTNNNSSLSLMDKLKNFSLENKKIKKNRTRRKRSKRQRQSREKREGREKKDTRKRNK